MYCSIVMPVKLLQNCNLCGSSPLNIVSPLTSWKLLSVCLDQLKATISCPRQNFYFKELEAVATHVCHVEIFFYSIEVLIFGQYSGSNYFLKHNWKSFVCQNDAEKQLYFMNICYQISYFMTVWRAYWYNKLKNKKILYCRNSTRI